MLKSRNLPRDEFETAEKKRESQRAYDLAIYAEHSEKLNKIEIKIDSLFECLNHIKGREEERERHRKEETARQQRIDSAVRWVEAVRGSSGWIAGAVLGLLGAIWWLAAKLLIHPVIDLLNKSKGGS